MANPQIEDGHVKIANEIAEHLSTLNLSAYEWRVLWAIWRKTYGWHKKTDRISYTQFEEITGVNRRHVARAINLLKARNIINVSGNKHSLEYSFQKDYDKWVLLPKGATTHHNITEGGNEALPKGVIESVTEGGNEALPKGVIENETGALPPLEKSLPPSATKTLPKGVNTKAKSIIQKHNNIRTYGSSSHIKEIFALITHHLGYEIPNYAKEGTSAKRALAMGFTPEQFVACWQTMKSFAFWQGKWLPFAKVTENLGEFVAGRLQDSTKTRNSSEPKVRDPNKYTKGRYGHLVQK